MVTEKKKQACRLVLGSFQTKKRHDKTILFVMIPTWLLCYITNQVFVAQTKHRKLEALEKKNKHQLQNP